MTTQGLKEQVKRGKLTAAVALRMLLSNADDKDYVRTTRTYKWLANRAEKEAKG